MNTPVARLENPSQAWTFEDPYIRDTLSTQATRILTGALAGLPEYPSAVGLSDGVPDLAREVVVLADGSLWLYADDLDRPILTPGAVGVCHKCGDRDRIDGVFHVGWRKVVVEFAFCVGCMASHVAYATQYASAHGVGVEVRAV